MKREGGSKKLTLYKETLRRCTRELTDQQLAKVLGGDGDGGALRQCTDTIAPMAACPRRGECDCGTGTAI